MESILAFIFLKILHVPLPSIINPSARMHSIRGPATTTAEGGSRRKLRPTTAAESILRGRGRGRRRGRVRRNVDRFDLAT